MMSVSGQSRLAANPVEGPLRTSSGQVWERQLRAKHAYPVVCRDHGPPADYSSFFRRHNGRKLLPMSAKGHWRTSASGLGMSALSPKADILRLIHHDVARSTNDLRCDPRNWPVEKKRSKSPTERQGCVSRLCFRRTKANWSLISRLLRGCLMGFSREPESPRLGSCAGSLQ